MPQTVSFPQFNSFSALHIFYFYTLKSDISICFNGDAKRKLLSKGGWKVVYYSLIYDPNSARIRLDKMDILRVISANTKAQLERGKLNS